MFDKFFYSCVYLHLFCHFIQYFFILFLHVYTYVILCLRFILSIYPVFFLYDLILFRYLFQAARKAQAPDLERVAVAKDGSCGFWCLLAFEGLVEHATVRTLEEEDEISRKFEVVDQQITGKVQRNESITRQDEARVALSGVLQPTHKDYATVQEFRGVMVQADASWSKVRHRSSFRSLQCELLSLLFSISVNFSAIYFVQVLSSSSTLLFSTRAEANRHIQSFIVCFIHLFFSCMYLLIFKFLLLPQPGGASAA